jgi:Asp-tRNA(Asn)/Glu-tRNA(Gln) amidotransferase B subunit
MVVEKVIKNEKLKAKQYSDGPKMTFNWMIKDIMNRWKIYPEELHHFYKKCGREKI